MLHHLVNGHRINAIWRSKRVVKPYLVQEMSRVLNEVIKG